MTTFPASLGAWFPALLGLSAVLLAFVGYKGWERFARAKVGRHGLTQKTLLTGNEVDFFHRLQRALGPRWVVFPQVSMGALIDTRLKPAHPDYWDVRATFSSKICDFVVCDARTLKPQLVIELDDIMHDFAKDRVRDSMVAKAGYRTVRFWSRKKPSDTELKAILAKELALN